MAEYITLIKYKLPNITKIKQFQAPRRNQAAKAKAPQKRNKKNAAFLFFF